jgi:O-antigen/teichoic acid export membrane protein
LSKSVLNTLIARFLSTGLNFFIALLLARHAGPELKGDVTLLITTIWFLVFLSNVLGGQALVYLIPRNKIELLVLPAYLWALLVSFGGFLVLKWTHLIHANHIPAIALLSFFSALISIHQTILFSKKQFSNANLIQILSLLIQLCGILLCYYFLRIHDTYAYIYSSVVAYGITALLSFFLVQRLINLRNFKKDFSWREWTQSIRFGFFFQLVEILQLLNLRYYFFQLGLQQGSKYLGIYSIGISILETVWIVPRSLATVHYVTTSNTNEINQEAKKTLLSVRMSLAISAVLLLLVFLLPTQLYVFVFGEGFSAVKHSIRFLFPGIFIYSIPLVLSSFYFGIGKYKPLLVSNAAGAITMVMLSLFLLPRYVMSGAGLAATCSFTVAAIVLSFFFFKNYPFQVSELLPTFNEWTELRERVLIFFRKKR